jgi:hypothetical protein
MFHTYLKHNLLPGDTINIHIYNDDGDSSGEESTPQIYTTYSVVVDSIGNNGYDSDYYFSLRLNDVSTNIELAYSLNTSGKVGFRIEKIYNSKPCRYYVRKFKKIPNFSKTRINVNDGINDDEINSALQTSDFSSSLNKLSFSKTIYGDDVAQIVYDDDINISGLKDNLGRELSVVYLTLVKTNYGHDKWYSNDSDRYTNKNIEYSHCFGNVTSGFDLPSVAIDKNSYNVRRQHNIVRTFENSHYIPESTSFIEDNITIKGGCGYYEFYGDIVELDVETLTETVIEPIYHRFNTAQRETSNNKFSQLVLDDIVYDDYMDVNGFSGVTRNAMCPLYRANLAAEGDYYQPHYPIKIKEFDTEVNTGYHTKIIFTYESGDTITTDVNYYLETNSELYMFHKSQDNTHKYIVKVGEVGGYDFTTVQILIPSDLQDTDLNNYFIFKPNILKPSTAYDFGDIEQPEFIEKTGRYIWRDILPSSKIMPDSEIYDLFFTNGTIYIHKDINFYLKRQDPFGEYGLQPDYHKELESCIQPADLEVTGNEKDITEGDYFEPGENNMC